jgi:diguanylate cyclase (GGDEF)-like protein
MTLPSSPRILLVEDNEDDALLLQGELKRALSQPYFKRVDNEAALRAALMLEDWDLVICDHSLPQMDSDRALELMRECGRQVPFVIYSGRLEESLALRAMRSGAHDFVDKHEPARLVPVVERELRNSVLLREKRAAECSIIELSRYDALTRLPNRKSLDHALQQALDGAVAAGCKPGLLVLDTDRFMRINDSLGYACGDQLMRLIANRLQGAAGADAYVARLGQDKFAVLLARSRDPANATTAAQCIERAFSQPFALQGHDVYVNFSIGLARFPEHGDEPGLLLRNAESAMFQAKRAGGNRTCIHDPGASHGAGTRFHLEHSLRGVIRRGELALMYQPIIEAASGRVIANEALVRWRHPQLGTVLPDQFIPLAEEAGLILEIGEWVLAEASRQTRAWRAAGHPHLKVSVNLSAEQFEDRALAGAVARIQQHTGLDPAALELEITESVAMRDGPQATALLQALKDTGLAIALDDFGIGFSSLSYLKRFPIDILKIDKSFVRGLPNAEEDRAIAGMIAALGRTLGLTLHAEGVETQAQHEYLVRLGVHRLQGYAIAAPMDARAATEFMDARIEPTRHRRA